MLETKTTSANKAIIVHIDFLEDKRHKEELDEIIELAKTAGAQTCEVIVSTRQVPDPKFLIGSGKVEELAALVQQHEPDVVVFNHSLSPSQERNLERAISCRVIDRTRIILDIFAQRARTFEGKLQVELAQLNHLSTRLIRGWTHLERQKGGIGLRGPGETQLETDRRLIRGRIKSIQKKLGKVRQSREQNRRARRRSAIPVITLVGYTNAGKSTLFNQLCESDVYVEDQLFATLDPTLRRVEIEGHGSVLVADTVGFIRHLPHDLVEAFRATLEEVLESSLLLHVVDISAEHKQEQIEQVNQVLADIEADELPQLMVYNKIDLSENAQTEVSMGPNDKPEKVWVSAQTGEGMALLKQAIGECVFGEPILRHICLTPAEAAVRAKLYEIKAVLQERVDNLGNWLLTIRLSKANYTQFVEPVIDREHKP